MSNATYEILEYRAVIKPDWTELYILCGPASDGTLGVQGWHKTVISKDAVVMDALRNALLSGEYLTAWDMGAPA
jgi:hypothetical protein